MQSTESKIWREAKKRREGGRGKNHHHAVSHRRECSFPSCSGGCCDQGSLTRRSIHKRIVLCTMANKLSAGFIGCGMMASAMMDGLIAKKVVDNPDCIVCSDIYQPNLDLAAAKGITAAGSNEELCKNAIDVVILAVKPFAIEEVCKDIVKVPSDALIVSIAAGVTLDTLQKQLPGRRVVRVMPNTPCLVGEAASGFAMGALCKDKDREIVQRIFGSVGIAKEIKEVLLNAVTGLSGSGPAYVYEFIEALADGGVRSGLPREVALQLAAQTVKGAATMVLETGIHPGQLKDNVCSPGGTTIAGVETLEKW